MPRKAVVVVVGLILFFGCGAIRPVPLEELEQSQGELAANVFLATVHGKIEAFIVRPKGRGPFPLMILLHGHSWRSMGAERILPVAEFFARDLCYASLAVSLPGYGQTEVPQGANPEITLKVVLDAISVVKGLPWIDGQRLYLYGFSRGGIFTAALVTRIPGLRGVVLHSGAYDLNRLYRQTPHLWLRAMLNPSGDPDATLFSVLPEVPKWQAPALILHGFQDSLIPVDQAILLGDSLQAAKKPHQLVLYPDHGHRLPSDEVRKQAVSFLEKNSGSACSVSGP